MWERSPQEEDKEVRKNTRVEDMESSFDFCQRITKMMDAYKVKVAETLMLMDMENSPSNNNIKVWMKELARTQVDRMD
jgi:hypothetical protein